MSTIDRKLNWKPGPKDDRDFKSTRHAAFAATPLPASYELPLQIPIYDQLDLGSCTSNSGCACYRFESAQLTGDFRFDPSRLFLYYNTRLLEGTQDEDAGAYIRDVFKALNKQGLAPETDLPYITSDFAKVPSQVAYNNGLKNLVVKYTSVAQDIDTIKQTVLSGAAVSFGFNVYSSFQSGNWPSSTGIMPLPKKQESLLGGHAVTIIGWDDAKKCFLIQNSWGEDWGKNGKFWMPFSFLLDPTQCDDFWCIDSIKVVTDDPTPPPVDPTKDALAFAKILFQTPKELWATKKPTIVRLGALLSLDVSMKYSFQKNYDVVKQALSL